MGIETVRTLLGELSEIEAYMHNYADPQLAMASKQRELLERMAKVLQRHDDTLTKAGDQSSRMDGYAAKLDALIQRFDELGLAQAALMRDQQTAKSVPIIEQGAVDPNAQSK